MTTTFGRYRLLERLGQGGMAEVFKAKSYGVEGFEKVVVIKRILPSLAESKEFVDMFIHEAKLAVRLSHANIVQVFDLGLAPGTAPDGKQTDAYYMAMEYVNGFDLATIIARSRRAQKPLPIEMCVYVAAEVAKGLDHAHRRRDEQNAPLGIVHRDVSPQNVLVSLEGEVKVTDFGIAKARGVLEPTGLEDTRARQLQGKFAYMSPEHAAGESVDARSDLFSLGTLLYECVAGVNPFTGPTTFETLRRVQACEYPPIELLRADVPPELAQILKNAMALAPDARFSDAGRMYEALLAFLYTQGRRYGAHDLAEYVAGLRSREGADDSQPLAPMLESDASAQDRTPVEVPTSMRPSSPSFSRIEVARVVDLERTAGMGERREVTALVLELPNREDTVARERATTIVERYGGRIFQRDPSILAALFGLAEPDGRDTEIATRCALVALRALGAEHKASAGLHAARVHVSPDGEATNDERLAGLLDAARDLARTRAGACAVSATAMRQVKNLFVFEPAQDAPPGISSTTTLIVADVRRPSDAFGKFVGRREELRRVGEVLAQATRKSVRVLTIRGDHGIGKTRLLVEIERRLKKLGYNVGWHVAACPPSGRDLPLSGIVCMLQSLCGVEEGDGEDRIRDVGPRLRALGLNDEEVAATLRVLGASGVAFAGNVKETLRSAFGRMVASLCEDRPHVFAWDAAHSMDADSFDVLARVVDRSKSARVVFALSARAGFSHPLTQSPAHVGLDLAELKPEDAERLIAQRLGVDTVPPELSRFVIARAAGHPHFIEEVLKGLVDASAVTVAERAVVSMRLVGQDLALPKTLRGLVASRVARLSPQDRAILQAAAVLGGPIGVDVLAQMTGQSHVAVDRSLAVLATADFVVHTGPSELAFKSPLVPEIVVDALPHEAARDMHAAAAQALETVLAGRAWEQAARIAGHMYEAGDRERAATYFAKSGERRLEGRQLEAAARDYARAIEMCDATSRDPNELAVWLTGLAAAVRLVRSLPEAPELCERVIARLDIASDLPKRTRARIDAGRILSSLHMFDAARAQFSQAEYIAQGSEPLVKASLVASAELAGRQGDFKRSLELLERLQTIATSEGDKQEEHKILIGLSQAHAANGDHAGAVREFDRAERALPNDAMAASERQKLRGLIEYFSRDFAAAAASCEKGVDMARDLGLTYEVAINLHNLGDILVRNGDNARAYGAFKQSAALSDDAGFERLGSHNRMFLAYLDALRGDPEAEKQLVLGIRYAEANDFTWDVIGGRVLLAQLLAHRGDQGAARLEFERVRVLARDAGNRMVAEDCDKALRSLV